MDYTGRRILEIVRPNNELEELLAIKEEKDFIVCLRCNARSKKGEVTLPVGAYFCPHCLELGRVHSLGKFYHRKPKPQKAIKGALTWKGELTKGQENISQKIVQTIAEEKSLLVHAVTGAGKTEMIFKGIEEALACGKRVGIAIPRVDVCMELYPRMQEAFSTVEIGLLHGKNKEEFRDLPLIICTTHQLLRFYHYFDVLIVDEADAFPFAYNEQLAFAMKNACQMTHSLIYLTATPDKELLKKMETAVLPARFHRKPLVVPQFVWCKDWRVKIKKKQLPKSFQKAIQDCIADGFPFLIFCPVISLLPLLKEAISKTFKDLSFETVSSIDPERLQKVELMRERKLQCLITTTILERGVTFADVSVLIFGANHQVYTHSSLVQISGRVGRKLSRPTGRLIYLHDGKTRAMIEAKKQIENMNKLALELGLIETMEEEICNV